MVCLWVPATSVGTRITGEADPCTGGRSPWRDGVRGGVSGWTGFHSQFLAYVPSVQPTLPSWLKHASRAQLQTEIHDSCESP